MISKITNKKPKNPAYFCATTINIGVIIKAKIIFSILNI